MTTPRTRKPAATKPTPRAKALKKARPNVLVEEADRAQRVRLLAELEAAAWNLGHAATALRLHGAPAVIRYLQRLAPKEYAAAKKAGHIVAGARSKA